jgi:VWFA-related protein
MKRRVLFLIFLIGACSASLLGQQRAAFRAGTDAVLVSVAVREKNRPVPGLGASDFVLTDNGVRQEVASATIETTPVDVMLVLDTSGSVRGAAFETLKANIHAISRALDATDRVRVISFDDRVTDVRGWQPGGGALQLEGMMAGGSTSFYNALAAGLVLSPNADRPQMVFAFSDGLDTASFLEAQQLVTAAGYSGTALYVAFVRPPMMTPRAARGMPGRAVPNRDTLEEAATLTGGALYEMLAGDSMVDTFRKVLAEFRSNYVLSYAPKGVPPQGWHDIVVTVPGRPNATVRARRGYESGGSN